LISVFVPSNTKNLLKMPSHESNKNTMAKKNGLQPRKKRGGGNGHHDDEDVDSKGNIKGLINYDYDSEDESLFDTETEETESSKQSSGKSPIARRTRNALKKKSQSKSSKKRKYSSESEEESSSSEEYTSEEERKEAKLIQKLREEKQKLQRRLREKDEEENKHKRRRLKKKVESETESESEEYEEEDEDDYTEDEEDSMDEEDDEYDEDEDEKHGGIVLSFGIDEGVDDKMVPKRHNMKKEPEEVKKFVKLITTPSDEDTIDGQIDQFKALPEDQRKKLLNVLENRSKGTNVQQGLMFKILTMNLPTEVQSMVLSKYNSLQSLDPGTGEYFKHRNWLEKLTSLPLGIYKDLPVKISDGSETCGAFMERARKCLDEAIYGQDEAKLQILQFIGTKIANPDGRGLSLLLAGPPGIGKTSLIKNGVAKAIQWPFQFISLGGDSDASTYTGHQLVYESSHCGKIVNSLCAAKSMSLVMMFDEVDKISATAKGEEVQNLLVHMTDPVQNGEFEDKYLAGVPIDLSRVMFTFSANYMDRIDKVLLDRMNVVQLQGYNLKEKVAIAENYLLPSALKEVGLGEKVGISKDIITHIVENYAKEEKGVRELKRCIEQIAQKVNMLRMFNTKELPFHIKDFALPYVLKKDHIDLFLKKKPQVDESIAHLYV
jgi:hypothetical protein